MWNQEASEGVCNSCNIRASKLERLCRYITRFTIADERLAHNKNRQNLPPFPRRRAVLKLRTPYRDGTTHIVMSLLEFKQRLAAGWYAGQGSTSSSSVSMACLRRMRKLCAEIIPGSKKNKSNASNANDPAPHSSASVRISWARLHKRVFEIDIEHTARIVAGI